MKTRQQWILAAMDETASRQLEQAKVFRRALRHRIRLESRELFLGEARALEISARAIRKYVREKKRG